MTTVETLAEYYGRTHRVIKQLLDGITHEDSLLQPPFRGNCLNWVLGHIVFNRTEVLTLLGEGLPWSAAESDLYKPDSNPITSAEQALALEQLLAFLETSQTSILAGLARISVESLEAPVAEGETCAEHLASLHWHETYHTGQLELLRQLADKNNP